MVNLDDLNLFSSDKNFIRVVTFQSPVVINILKRDGIYFADINKCREENDYSKDIIQLNNKVPIWVFSNPNICYDTLKSGGLLETWRCEMSLDEKIGLTEFIMIELELNLEGDLLKSGVTHNSYLYASITDKIKYSQLCATYRIEATGHFYYKRIILEEVFNNHVNIITNNIIDTREINYPGIYKIKEDVPSKVSRCSYCEGDTNHYINDIPVCSEYCKDKIIDLCKKCKDSSLRDANYDGVFNMLDCNKIRLLRFGEL